MNKTITWKNLIGQGQIKDMLANAFYGNTLGHAYLFCGDPGVGTFQAALEMAMARLCESMSAAPCYACESCNKILRHAHPDFHGIVPVSLDKEHRASDGKLSPDGWTFLSNSVLSRISDPYAQVNFPAVPTIPVEWVKEVNHAIMRGAVSAAYTVAIIDGIDIMNKESANAMLKTLEEPPAGTLIMLLTSRPQSVLPTIASRCQTIRFGWLTPEQISGAIAGRFGESVSGGVKSHAVEFSGGSLGRAIDLCVNPPTELTRDARGLLEACARQDWQRLSVFVDELSHSADYERYERLLLHIMHLIRGDFLQKLSASVTYFNTGAAQGHADDLRLTDLNPETAGRYLTACQEALSGVAAYGNVSMVLVSFILSLMEIMHE